MRKSGAVFWAVALSVVASIGCSSGSDSSGGASGGAGAPNFTELETTLTKPTGTFDATQAGAATDSFSTQTAAFEENGFGGGGTSSTQSTSEISFKSVRVQDVGTSCPGLKDGGKGSCTCSAGGSISYDIPAGGVGAGLDGKGSGPIDTTIQLTAAQCGDSGSVINGGLYIKIKSLVADRSDLFLLYDIHLKISGAKTASYDVDALIKDGKVTFAVDVKDGKVLISAKGNWDKATKTGSFSITDKNGTWSCVADHGKGSCTDKDGQVHTFG